jgi:hypothetical protein
MTFADDFLRTLFVGSVLRYLAVAHFGRGRGNFVEAEAPAFWQPAVEAVMAAEEAQLSAMWEQLREAPDAAALAETRLATVARQTLQRLYPDSAAADYSKA